MAFLFGIQKKLGTQFQQPERIEMEKFKHLVRCDLRNVGNWGVIIVFVVDFYLSILFWQKLD